MLAAVVAELLHGPSETASVTVNVPPDAYTWLMVGPTASIPTPSEASKSQAYVSASPSGSADPLPSSVTGTPARPEYGPPALAAGQRLPRRLTVIVRDFVSLREKA